MTTPAPALVRAALSANQAMASRHTPFIFNEWYVAALSQEVGRKLLARKILGRNIVLFRTRAGEPVALDDRCAHRSFPLSRSTLEDDTIVCGYHGFRYDARGDCIEIPSQERCPKGIGVASYPILERGRLLWIWMGPPQHADESTIPAQPWLASAEWVHSEGYFHLPASYVSLHENLLDLTHLSYLHRATLGTADYARAPYEVKIEEKRFSLLRSVVPTRLPPVWAQPTGILGDQAARVIESEFITPALHLVTATFSDTAVAAPLRREFVLKTAHIPTPESQTSTHYFIVHGRDFALDSAAVTQAMHEQVFTAFQEDVDGLAAIEAVLAEAGDSAHEISVKSDHAAIAMRKYLKRRSDEEQAMGSTAAGPPERQAL